MRHTKHFHLNNMLPLLSLASETKASSVFDFAAYLISLANFGQNIEVNPLPEVAVMRQQCYSSIGVVVASNHVTCEQESAELPRASNDHSAEGVLE